MGTFATIVSVCSGCVTVLGFIGIFVKYGKDKGTTDTTISTLVKNVETLTKMISDLPAQSTVDELRKDVDKNAVDINNLGAKVNQIQIDNIKMITTLSSDMGWIKSTLDGINKKLDERGGRNA